MPAGLMLTYDQWMDILGYLVVGSIALLLSINISLRRQRTQQRADYQQQIQELEKRLQLYDQYTTQLRDDLARYKALVEDQRISLEELSDQLNLVIKTIHMN